MKYVRYILLLLVMILLLTACGAKEPEATGPVAYHVLVQDQAGEPIKGVMVQLCSDVCIPGITDEEGIATFEVAEDDYKVSVLSMPEGYANADETREFLFEDGSRELTIRLKKDS